MVSRLGEACVFRFNFDLWRDYAIRMDAGGFELTDPTGRRVDAGSVAKLYWRKPQTSAELFPDRPATTEERYPEAELWYTLREMAARLRAAGKAVLVEPFAEARIGKMTQLRAAAGVFPVPPWRFVRGVAQPAGPAVVKSLTLERVAPGKVLYATRLDAADLDPAMPWFICDYVEARLDVTVVYVRGRMFAFEFPRHRFLDRAIDWRAVALEPGADWVPHTLPADVAARLTELMGRLRLHYGRIDLLLGEAGEYVFLEVNPNGEWGWLDKHGDHGVLEAILAEVSPLTPVHPLPL